MALSGISHTNPILGAFTFELMPLGLCELVLAFSSHQENFTCGCMFPLHELWGSLLFVFLFVNLCYLYICVCVCACMCSFVHTYVHIHKHMHMHAHTHRSACTQKNHLMYPHITTHACMETRLCIHAHTSKCKCKACEDVFAAMHTCMHNTHTCGHMEPCEHTSGRDLFCFLLITTVENE